MKWANWWRGLLEDYRFRRASHSKFMALMGSIAATGIMIREAIHDRMNSEYFWAYLGILVAGAAASKYLSAKTGGKLESPEPEEVTNNVDDGPKDSKG